MIKLRKLLACLMIVCMAFSLMPLAAFATEGEPCTHVAGMAAVSMYAACAAKKLRTALKRASARYAARKNRPIPMLRRQTTRPRSPQMKRAVLLKRHMPRRSVRMGMRDSCGSTGRDAGRRYRHAA